MLFFRIFRFKWPIIISALAKQLLYTEFFGSLSYILHSILYYSIALSTINLSTKLHGTSVTSNDICLITININTTTTNNLLRKQPSTEAHFEVYHMHRIASTEKTTIQAHFVCENRVVNWAVVYSTNNIISAAVRVRGTQHKHVRTYEKLIANTHADTNIQILKSKQNNLFGDAVDANCDCNCTSANVTYATAHATAAVGDSHLQFPFSSFG